MRILAIICGIAILINAFHMAHFIQHYSAHVANATPGFWLMVAFALAVDLLSIVGGVLLLRRSAAI